MGRFFVDNSEQVFYNKRKTKGCSNMEKVFHPTIKSSTVTEMNGNMLSICAGMLHDLGWLTQQGMFEEAVERLRWLAENKPEAFLMGCATGLTAVLGAMPQTVSEQLSDIPHTPVRR